LIDQAPETKSDLKEKQTRNDDFALDSTSSHTGTKPLANIRSQLLASQSHPMDGKGSFG
jgi:hypothetical protein